MAEIICAVLNVVAFLLLLAGIWVLGMMSVPVGGCMIATAVVFWIAAMWVYEMS